MANDFDMADPVDEDEARVYVLDTWTDANGKVWRLEDMTKQHQINVLGHLRKTALYRYIYYQLQEEFFDPWEPDGCLGILPIMVQIEASLHKYTEEEALAWMEEQYLVKRLKVLTKEDNRVAFVDRMKARLGKHGRH